MLASTSLMPTRTDSTGSKTLSKSMVSCSLIWRNRKLFVRAASQEDSLNLAVFQDSDRLVECLKRSPVELVKLDSDLGPEMLLRWAEACGKAKKACYVSRASDLFIKMPSSAIGYALLTAKKGIHRSIAGVMAALLFPILIVLSPTFRLTRCWAVGARGQVLDVLSVNEFHVVSSGRIARMVSTLARLLNVVQGKMLLNEPMPQRMQDCFEL